MKSAPKYKGKHDPKKNKFQFLAYSLSILFFLSFAAILTTLSLRFVFDNNSVKYTNQIHTFNQTDASIQPHKGIESCDLFEGRWIPDPNASLYTNHSCVTIPWSKNCLLHGKDGGFLNWKWKPDQCELPRFNAVTFLSILRGKKMAFIGDSLARNQMESLLCLLSTVETPKSTERDEDDKNATWEFPEHDFTLTVIWSPFLIAATDIVVNGTNTGNFNLHLDRVDARWSEKLPSIDYVVFNGAHWFRRPHDLYEGGVLTGCIYCQARNLTEFGPGLVIRSAFRTAFRAINECKNCKGVVSFLRTHSPDHFENGEWNTGGRCKWTRPIGPEEVDRAHLGWEYRKFQVEEAERGRREGIGKGNVFEVVDVMEMMSMRVDGHPDLHWGNQWLKNSSDCLHWCMPGPIDTWNGLLLEMIKRRDKISS